MKKVQHLQWISNLTINYNLNINYKVEIPPLNSWKFLPGEEFSPVGNLL